MGDSATKATLRRLLRLGALSSLALWLLVPQAASAQPYFQPEPPSCPAGQTLTASGCVANQPGPNNPGPGDPDPGDPDAGTPDNGGCPAGTVPASNGSCNPACPAGTVTQPDGSCLDGSIDPGDPDCPQQMAAVSAGMTCHEGPGGPDPDDGDPEGCDATEKGCDDVLDRRFGAGGERDRTMPSGASDTEGGSDLLPLTGAGLTGFVILAIFLMFLGRTVTRRARRSESR